MRSAAGLEYYDMPAVRKVVQDARANDYPVLVHRARHRPERAVPDEGDQMRIITKKHLSRRTFLHGMGVTLSLPLLESMVPAQTPLAKRPRSLRFAWGSVSSRTAP